MQPFLIIVLAMPLVASGNSGGMFLDDLLSGASHGDSSLKADSDAARERVKQQLAQLEKIHDEHLVAHEDAQTKLEAIDDEHQTLADLKSLPQRERLALQATNDADRDKVKRKLARLAAGSSLDKEHFQNALEMELVRLDARHEVFESATAQVKASAAKEDARARAHEQLTKLQELHKKAAAAPKSMRGTTARHILQKDPAFIQALAHDISKDAGDSVHLAQTGATIIPGRRRKGGGGDWTFALVAAVGAFAVTYCTVGQQKAIAAGGSVAHNPFEGQGGLRSKAD